MSIKAKRLKANRFQIKIDLKTRPQKTPAGSGSGCGAGAPGRPGFQPGNRCAKGDGSKISDYADCRPQSAVAYVGEGDGKRLATDEELIGAASRYIRTEGLSAIQVRRELAGLAGVVDNAKVKIIIREDKIKVSFSHEDSGATGTRYIQLMGGQVTLENVLFEVQREKRKRGGGLGAKMLARQVAYARKHGINRITTYAAGEAGDPDFNGYMTWPRIGYIGDIPPRLIRDLPDSLSRHTRVEQLMGTQEGRDWWRENGHSFQADFDPREGSLSSRVLEEYLEQKFGGGGQKSTKAAKPAKPAAGSSCGSGAPGRPGFQPGNQCAKGKTKSHAAMRRIAKDSEGHSEDRKLFGQTIDTMSEMAALAASESITRVHFTTPEAIEKKYGKGVLGCFDSGKRKKGRITVPSSEYDDAAQGTLDHELGHAVDAGPQAIKAEKRRRLDAEYLAGDLDAFTHSIMVDELERDFPKVRFSDSPEWRRVWEREIRSEMRVSAYAGEAPWEGFAEFHRLICFARRLPAEDRDQFIRAIEHEMPGCVDLWKGWGIW